MSIFGCVTESGSRLKELCKAEESELFKKLVEKAMQKRRDKKQELEGLRTVPQSRLSLLPARTRQALRKKYAKRRARCANTCFRGALLSWTQIRRNSGGDSPVFFVEDVDLLPGAGLDTIVGRGGQVLRDFVKASVDEFIAMGIHPCRRAVLVPKLASASSHVLFLAVVVGAGVQEEPCRPLLRYRGVPTLTLACSKEFCAANKCLLQIAKTLNSRTVRFGGASPFGKQSHRLLSEKEFCKQAAELVAKAKAKEAKKAMAAKEETAAASKAKAATRQGAFGSWCLLTQGKTDKVLSKLPEEARKVAMSFSEFLAHFGRADDRPLWSTWT